MLRNEKTQPICSRCNKYDAATGTIWEKFGKRNRYYFDAYLACKTFSVLPRSGGYDQQDPDTMKMLMLIDLIFKTRTKEKE